MRRIAANVIVGIFAAVMATALGAEIRQDYAGDELVRDFAIGATIGTAAAAIKWAMAELESGQGSGQ